MEQRSSSLCLLLAKEGTVECITWNSVHCHLASVRNGKVTLWNVGPENSELCMLLDSYNIMNCTSESFIPFIINADKEPYVAYSVHFSEDGSGLLVAFLKWFVYMGMLSLVQHTAVDCALQSIHGNSNERKKQMVTCPSSL